MNFESKINKSLKIHIAGIGGEGMSWIAKVLLEQGNEVTGSDMYYNNRIKYLQEMGLKSFELEDATNNLSYLSDSNLIYIDFLLHSDALLFNPLKKIQLENAKKKGVKIYNRREFFSVLLKERNVLAVAGTSGKTTTSSLLAFLLDSIGDSCGFGIGGTPINFGFNSRNGFSKNFVIEADEFSDSFLGIIPNSAIITNINMDHHDFFHNFENYINSFENFINSVEDHIIICGDDENLMRISKKSRNVNKIISYGKKITNDCVLQNININKYYTSWDLQYESHFYHLKIPLVGEQFAFNATSAFLFCCLFYDNLKSVNEHKQQFIEKLIYFIEKFKGVEGRMTTEKIDNLHLMYDHGHHPIEIKTTLQGLKKTCNRIIAIFEPHQFRRSNEMKNEFKQVLNSNLVDYFIQVPIYASRESEPYPISNLEFFDFISEKLIEKVYIENFDSCPNFVLKYINKINACFDDTQVFDDIVIIIFSLCNGEKIAKPISNILNLRKDNITRYKNKKVLIMGLGGNGGGEASTKFFVDHGAQVLVTDLNTPDFLKASLDNLSEYKNIKYHLSGHLEEDFRNQDLIIKNPGVNPNSYFLKLAMSEGINIETIEGIFFSYLMRTNSNNIIGITGTKGKTTTSYLVYECFKSNGIKAHLTGNMGIPMINSIYNLNPGDWIISEISSFQCEALEKCKFSPNYSIITNISEDHLNFYPSYYDYAMSKTSIFKYQKPENYLILNKQNEFLYEYLKLCTLNPKNIILVDEKSEQFTSYFNEMKMKGLHNLKNINLVFNLAEIIGLDLIKCINAIKEFNGVPGRIELIGKIKGILFVNDSASTTTFSTISALEVFKNDNPVIILGGIDKGLNYDILAKKIIDENISYILIKSKVSEKLIQSGLDREKSTICDDIHKAVESAYFTASNSGKERSLVLLSPAAAAGLSNLKQRGEKFKETFRMLKNIYENNI